MARQRMAAHLGTLARSAFDIHRSAARKLPERGGGQRLLHHVEARLARHVERTDRQAHALDRHTGTDGQAFVGRPIVMTVRRILERCRTIDEAIAEVRDNPVFVSNGVLLASGPENRVVVAEVGPHGFGVRPMTGDALVLTPQRGRPSPHDLHHRARQT